MRVEGRLLTRVRSDVRSTGPEPTCPRRAARAGRAMARHALIALAMLGLGLSACTTNQPTPVDGNLAVETVFGGLALPSAVRFAPNGHVFVAEREGVVKRFDSLSDGAPTV